MKHELDDRLAQRLESLARWWASASQEARLNALKAAIHGEARTPSISDLHLAAYLAEAEAGTVEEG